AFILLSIFFVAAAGAISYFLWKPFAWSFVIIVPIIALGISDMMQTHHTLMKNYPVVGRLRWLAEWLRPKMYQYFVESDTDGAPFNRLSRSVIYQRAKKVN